MSPAVYMRPCTSSSDEQTGIFPALEIAITPWWCGAWISKGIDKMQGYVMRYKECCCIQRVASLKWQPCSIESRLHLAFWKLEEGWEPHRIDCASDNSAQWIPGAIIKPVPHVIESILCEELSDSVIEVGIELMDDTLVLDH